MNYANKIAENKIKFETLCATLPHFVKFKVFAFDELGQYFDLDEIEERSEADLKEMHHKGAAALRFIAKKLQALDLN